VTHPGWLATLFSAILGLSATVHAAKTPETGADRQPRNIYALIRSFDHTFARVLTPEQFEQYRYRSPNQVKENQPELFARISQDVKAWTDLWIHHVRTDLVPIPAKRLDAAHAMAQHLDSVMNQHFKERGWAYRPLDVVFLPPQVFLDEAHRGDLTAGMFIPYYPDSIFVSVDWPIPVELVLAHEILHYNETKDVFGLSLEEGLADIGGRYFVVKYGILTAFSLKRVDTYPTERKGVELVLDAITKRTGKSRDEAVDQLLGAMLTGNQDQMKEVFGAEAWQRVTKLSYTRGDWQAHRIKAALGE
jgi:hypothetical protein